MNPYSSIESETATGLFLDLTLKSKKTVNRPHFVTQRIAVADLGFLRRWGGGQTIAGKRQIIKVPKNCMKEMKIGSEGVSLHYRVQKRRMNEQIN